MTGYGYAERQDESIHATVEVKSVNNRYLDVNVNLPGILGPLETEIRERVGGVAARGRVDVFVRVRELQESLAVAIDRQVLAGYLAALGELREAAGIDEPVALADLLSVDGIIKTDRSPDRDRYWDIVAPLLDEALADFAKSRSVEGARLVTDIESQVARIRAALLAIEGHATGIDTQVRAALGAKFAEVVGDAVEESRMLAEVAVQLVRFSINEEIVRLGAHVDTFLTTLHAGRPAGKRLDFLCQEMNREINTIGSKSIVLSISEQVVEAKDALENVREQLRNVE